MVLARVRRTIAERRLLARGDHVLVACSGGGDSVALTRLLARLAPELGVSLAIASVDHGLRPEAAEEVAEVGRLAEALSLPFHPLRVRVEPAGEGLQAAARRARYAALHRCAAERGAGKLAVGHTLEDQAETVLARLLRGAGLAGAAGIHPAREDGVVRPLIDCRRAELRAWLRARGVGWRDDPSNADPRFERVRIRALGPALEAIDPRALEHLAAFADDARAVHGVLARRAEAHLEARGEGALEREALLSLDAPTRAAVLARALADTTGRPPSRAHLDALEATLASGRGEVLLGGDWGARLVEGRLELARRPRRTRSTRTE